MHAVGARSTSPSQKCQKKGAEHSWKSSCRSCATSAMDCAPCQEQGKCDILVNFQPQPPLQYISRHSTTRWLQPHLLSQLKLLLHQTTWITLHKLTLLHRTCAPCQYTAPQPIKPYYAALPYTNIGSTVNNPVWQYTTLTAPCFASIPFISLQYIAWQFATLHDTSLPIQLEYKSSGNRSKNYNYMTLITPHDTHTFTFCNIILHTITRRYATTTSTLPTSATARHDIRLCNTSIRYAALRSMASWYSTPQGTTWLHTTVPHITPREFWLHRTAPHQITVHKSSHRGSYNYTTLLRYTTLP